MTCEVGPQTWIGSEGRMWDIYSMGRGGCDQKLKAGKVPGVLREQAAGF